MFRRVFVLAIPLVLHAVPGLAQEQVTVVKRDSTRFTGRFEAWNRFSNQVYVRVSLNDQRILPLGDVLVIDVGGNAENLPAGETEAAAGADHVLVLASGEVVRGRLVNIEGGEGSDSPDEPRVVSFKPSTGAERRVRMNEIRRLYLGNYPKAASQPSQPAPAPEAPAPAGAIRVAANTRWVSTGAFVRRGDLVQFAATGEVRLSTDPEDMASTAGSLRGRHAAGAPAPHLLAGALIGRIGTSAPFGIGNNTQPLVMPADGELQLAVNDDEVSDNQGAFTVTLMVTRRRR